jgi:hypothetical protein
LSVFPRLYRLYRMTIATSWYDRNAEFQREYEMHFRSPGRGSIRSNRRALARRGMPYFQREIYRRHHVWIPLRRIRVNFETEEQTAAVQRAIEVVTRSMRYRGKHWSATELPTRTISYAKKRRRKRKVAKRTRAKSR